MTRKLCTAKLIKDSLDSVCPSSIYSSVKDFSLNPPPLPFFPNGKVTYSQPDCVVVTQLLFKFNFSCDKAQLFIVVVTVTVTVTVAVAVPLPPPTSSSATLPTTLPDSSLQKQNLSRIKIN